MEINGKQILKLTSPMCPSVNHYLPVRAIIKNGRPMAVPYKSAEAKKYQKEFCAYVKEQAKLQNWVVSDNKSQHYYMDCVFYFPRTDKDANNYFKCLADAITDSGVVWIDDTQLCERVQGIYYDSQNPRIEIEIYPVDYIGIFESEWDYTMFESKCRTCKRYSRNCSILNKALAGKIQDEICMNVCSKYSEKGEK